jgi:uncharacterized protein YacL
MRFFKSVDRFVLDSSSILDGRIVQLFSKKFFEGKIIVPQLVCSIVRKVSGSNGERALAQLQRSVPVEVATDKSDGLMEEACVLKIAKKKKAKVFTVSDELCRQAKSFPKVRVIDVRELYRTLIPIFTPDRLISVRILKKGLRAHEGVGYIEGVKIIVENGAKQVNHVVNARVLTMITSDKGSLVFCSLEEGAREAPRRRSTRSTYRRSRHGKH